MRKTIMSIFTIVLLLAVSCAFFVFPNARIAADAASVQLSWPCASGYTVTCMYYYKTGAKHSTSYGYTKAMDITGGGDIVAAESGSVVTCRDLGSSSFGKYVEIRHGDGSVTLYAHMSSFAVSLGQDVAKGQKIGVMGSTGNSSGTHLHFEWSGGDPWKTFFKGRYDAQTVFEQNVRENNKKYNADQTVADYIDSHYKKSGSYYYYDSSASAPAPAPAVRWEVDASVPTPIVAYPAATSGLITLYDNSLNAYAASARNIAWNDKCTINAVYKNGYCSVTYPTASGENTEKAAFSAFVPGYAGASDYKPGKNLTTYVRSDLSAAFGTVFANDSCKLVGRAGGLYQIVYPVNGGYKLGWIDPNYAPNAPDAPEPARPAQNVPGPVASGVFSGKSVVAMAPHKIVFSASSYIDEGDICRLTGIDPATGLCTVEYPSGSNDVFSASKTRFQTVAITEFIDYNGGFSSETASIDRSLTVYPTSAMTQRVGGYNSNWCLDPGDTYTTINRSGSATELLYYCSRGGHQGYWKLGWVYLDYYYLDLNGNLDGADSGGLRNYGTADVYINGTLRAKDANDFYTGNGTFPAGSTYEIRNIKAYNGYTYNGVSAGAVSGTLNGNKSVYLKFTKKAATCTGLAVTKNPTKTVYLEGEALNTAGLAVTAYFSDGAARDVAAECGVSGYSNTPGDKTVSVSYGGKTAAFSVTVKEKSPTSIVVVTPPAKTSYYVGDKVLLTGLTVKAVYDNGSAAAVTDYTVGTEGACAAAGAKTLTVAYCRNDAVRTATFDITVLEPQIKLSSAALSLKKGASAALTATTAPASQTVVWRASDPSVATAANGVVTAAGKGTATVTASFVYNGKTYAANAAVTVEAPTPVRGGTLRVSSAAARPGETVRLSVSAENNPGFSAFVLGFEYDAASLRLRNAEIAPALGGQFTFGKKAVWVGGADTTYNGELMSLTFEVLPDAPEGDTAVGVTYAAGDISNRGEADVLFALTPGKVTVSAPQETQKEVLTAANVTLGAAKIPYDGEVHLPSVRVKNAAGQTLAVGEQYTVTYPAGAAEVGSYTCTVKGAGQYAGTVYKTYQIVPAAVIGVRAEPTASGEITVRWDAADGATEYRVFRYRGDLKKYVELGQTENTSYTVSGLYGGTTYYFKVLSAARSGGKTLSSAAYSAAASAQCLSAPAVPKQLSAAATAEGTVTVRWALSKNATQYNVYRYNGTKKAYVYLGTSKTASYDVRGLNNGTTYYFKVVPVTKAAGLTLVGAFSPAVTARCVGKPGVPAGLQAKRAASKAIGLCWKATAGATEYTVYRYNGTLKKYVVVGGTADTSLTVTGLCNGVTYYFKVAAVSAAEDLRFTGDPTAAVSLKCAAAPKAPENLTVKAVAPNELALSWNGSADAAKYVIYSRGETGSEYVKIGETALTGFTAEKLAAGKTYSFRVAAVSSAGDRADSAAVSAKALGVPAAPGGLTAAVGVDGTALIWKAVCGATQYNVYRAADDGVYRYVGTAFTEAFTDRSPAAGRCSYKVVSVMKGGGMTFISAYSAPVTAAAAA